MRALLCHRIGDIADLSVEDVAPPTPEAGEVIVGVHTCSLHFSDLLQIQGKYQAKRQVPFSPGVEIAGNVIAVGDRVTGFRAGDRVIAFPHAGGLMEQARVDARRCVRMPATMSYRDGCAFLATFGTAYYALHTRARLQPGETLLVLGAGGGAGLAAVAVGARLGGNVVAAASSPEKLALARAEGASGEILYSSGPLTGNQQAELRDQIKAAGGVDVVYDPVGGDYTEPALRAMRRNGRLLVVGFAAGHIPRIPTNLLLLKGCDIVGVYHGDLWQCDPEEYERQVAKLLEWFEQDQLRPRISSVVSLDEAPQALRALAERRAHGKLVVEVAAAGAVI